MPINAVAEGQRLVRQAVRINLGARNLIVEGGTPKMMEACQREMDRVVAEHRLLVTRAETRLRSHQS